MPGFTLLNLLVTLAVASTLAAATLPRFATLLQATQTRAVVGHALGAVRFARHAAIAYRTTVTVCPDDGIACGPRDTWAAGTRIFLDQDRNGRQDPNDVVLRQLPALASAHTVYWRSFRRRPYLQFEPSGLTAWQNGHLLICLDNAPRMARQIIINAQGRTRMARDNDGDGIVEDARGRPVTCPTP